MIELMGISSICVRATTPASLAGWQLASLANSARRQWGIGLKNSHTKENSGEAKQQPAIWYNLAKASQMPHRSVFPSKQTGGLWSGGVR